MEQVLVNGLIAGLNIGLMALAFSVVYLPTRVFFIALGGVYVLAPYVTWSAIGHGLPWPLSVVLAVFISVLLSVACEVVNHWPLEQKRSSAGAHLLSSLGILILIVQGVALAWGNEAQVLRPGLDATFTAAGIILTRSQLVSLIVCLCLLAGFFIWLRMTNLGLRLRGMADNPIEMALRGHNVRVLRIMAFAVSGLLAATAGLLMAFDIGFDPHVGMHAVLLAIVSTIIGGREKLLGPAVAGVALGVLRAAAVWYFSARWQEAITFLLLASVLLFRPRGIFRQKVRPEAGQ